MGVDDGNKYKLELKFSKEKIIAFDPGKVTGICVIYNECAEFGHFEYGSDLFNWLEKLEKNNTFDAYICEDYKVYPGMGERLIMDSIIPARIIGILEYIAHKQSKKFVLQLAAHVKAFWTDDKLKEYGCYSTNKHERDAARHALKYSLIRGD